MTGAAEISLPPLFQDPNNSCGASFNFVYYHTRNKWQLSNTMYCITISPIVSRDR